MSIDCARCLLNDEIPGVQVDADRICSVCRQHDERWRDWKRRKTERLSALERLFHDCRRKKRPYDVLVPLSGGKDSTYVLYLCRKRFNLKCLAVTWDNAFLTEHARDNIRNAVDLLGVDHIYYRINKRLLMQLYRFFLLTTGTFCPVCMRGIGVATEMAARAFNIPLVVNGTSARTEEHVAPEFFQAGPLSFFRNALQGTPLESEASALMYGGHWKRVASYYLFWWTKIERVFVSAAICLPDYIEWDYDDVFQTITAELGWKADRAEAEHTDCAVENVVQYMRQRKFPALTPELLRFSKLVTAGLMSRDEALRRVSERHGETGRPENLDWFLSALDISESEFEEVLRDPLRHMKYRKEPGRLWWWCRATKRAILNPLLGVGK